MGTRVRSVRSSGYRSLLTAGAPLITLLLGGSYVLSSFMETHYEVKDKRNKSISTRKFDLEEEHAKMMKDLNIDDYKLSRIPRAEGEQDTQRKKGASGESTTEVTAITAKIAGWFW